jgi:histidinol dehydrogenase
MYFLPTSLTTCFSSPLGEAGAQVLGKIASVLAHGEGLQANARAAEMWLKS